MFFAGFGLPIPLKPNILSTVTGNCPALLEYLMSILKYVSSKHIQLCFSHHLLFVLLLYAIWNIKFPHMTKLM